LMRRYGADKKLIRVRRTSILEERNKAGAMWEVCEWNSPGAGRRTDNKPELVNVVQDRSEPFIFHCHSSLRGSRVHQAPSSSQSVDDADIGVAFPLSCLRKLYSRTDAREPSCI
jgi:hypothetical protein